MPRNVSFQQDFNNTGDQLNPHLGGVHHLGFVSTATVQAVGSDPAVVKRLVASQAYGPWWTLQHGKHLTTRPKASAFPVRPGGIFYYLRAVQQAINIQPVARL
jgi:hypothetical protein